MVQKRLVYGHVGWNVGLSEKERRTTTTRAVQINNIAIDYTLKGYVNKAFLQPSWTYSDYPFAQTQNKTGRNIMDVFLPCTDNTEFLQEERMTLMDSRFQRFYRHRFQLCAFVPTLSPGNSSPSVTSILDQHVQKWCIYSNQRESNHPYTTPLNVTGKSLVTWGVAAVSPCWTLPTCLMHVAQCWHT